MNNKNDKLNISGETRIVRYNALGEITYDETEENAIASEFITALGGALVNDAYDWDGTTGTNLIALDSYIATQKVCVTLNTASDAGTLTDQYKAGIVFANASDQLALGQSTAAATYSTSPAKVQLTSSVTRVATTWDNFALGVIRTFDHDANTNAGSITYATKWATQDPGTNITVTAADTLSVTWTVNIG